MFSRRIDSLLQSIRAWRFLRMLLHCALLASGALLIRQIVIAAAEKYMFYYPVAAILIFAPILLYSLFRTVALFHSEKDPKLAGELDRRYELKDRIATYVELRGTPHAFLEPLITETERHLAPASAVRSAELTRGALAPLLFAGIPALLLAAMPFLPVPASVAEKVDQHKRIAAAARKLEEQAKKLEEDAKHLPELKKLAEEIQQLSRELQKPSTDPAEALKKLNAMLDRVREATAAGDEERKEALAKELKRMTPKESTGKEGEGPNHRQTQELARELEKALADQKLEAGQELQEALKNGKLSREQMQKMKESLEKYRKEQSETERRTAELRQSMENAKKSVQSGKTPAVYNSKVEDRDVEKGKGGVEDGPGTTNKDVGPQHFDTKKKGQGKYAEDLTRAEYEQLYKGQRVKAGSDPLFLDGQWDPQNARFTRIRSFGLESDSGRNGGITETVVQSDEEAVIGKEKVPASYRKLVRKYFESIQP